MGGRRSREHGVIVAVVAPCVGHCRRRRHLFGGGDGGEEEEKAGSGGKKEEKRNSGGLTWGWEGREEGRRKMIG